MTERCATCGGTMFNTGQLDRMTRQPEPPHCLSCGRTNTTPPTLESLQIVPRAVAHHNRDRGPYRRTGDHGPTTEEDDDV